MLFSEKIRLDRNNFLLLVTIDSDDQSNYIYLEIAGDNYQKLLSAQENKQNISLSEFGKIIIQGKGKEPTEVERYFIKHKYKLTS